MIRSDEVLLCGLGYSPQSWYRMGTVANHLNIPWIGITRKGPPPKFPIVTGNIANKEDFDFDQFKIIVLQQPVGDEWLAQIKAWKKQGKKVIFECDDFLHGVRKVEGHSNQSKFGKKLLKKFEECMRACDGMILSTDFLESQYKKYNPNTWVCKIGLETDLYNITIPKREWVAIGWAGGTGHHQAMGKWLECVSYVMGKNDHVGFVSIGTDYAQLLEQRHPMRTVTCPWTSIENFPFALTNIDIQIAPGHISKYYKSKSDLRWLQAGAVGIPTIADPLIYNEIQDGVTGLLADNEEDIIYHLERMIGASVEREKIGQQTKEYIQKNRSVEAVAPQWIKVFEDLI